MSEDQRTASRSHADAAGDRGSRCLKLDDVRADLPVLGEIRHLLAQFTHEIGLSEDLIADVLLATYEALANVVEHAYRPGESGTFDLLADDRTEDGVLTVAIIDHGVWKPEADNSRTRRGRGLRLMRACSDDVRVASLSGGTRIHLQWNYGRTDSLPDREQQVDP